MDAWKTGAIFGALKCKTERSLRQISCRFHQDSRVCLLPFNCPVSGHWSRQRSFRPSYCLLFPVTLESFRSSLITRSRSDWRFLALRSAFSYPACFIHFIQPLPSRLFLLLSPLMFGTYTVQKCWYSLGFPMTELNVRLAPIAA